MQISSVTMRDWAEFKHNFMLHGFSKAENEMDIQCIENCRPTTEQEVIGVYKEKELIGMMAYAERYLIKKVINDHQYEERELKKDRTKNSIPVIYIYSMIVRPDYRRSGLSIQMMNHLLNYTVPHYIMLNPSTEECNELVRKLGFDFHTKVYVQFDDVVLTKTV